MFRFYSLTISPHPKTSRWVFVRSVSPRHRVRSARVLHQSNYPCASLCEAPWGLDLVVRPKVCQSGLEAFSKFYLALNALSSRLLGVLVHGVRKVTSWHCVPSGPMSILGEQTRLTAVNQFTLLFNPIE